MIEKRRTALPRPELAKRICDAALEYSLVALVAPVGSGKTMATREVAALWAGKCAYTSAFPGGADGAFIWDRLVAQVLKADQEIGDILRESGVPQTPAKRTRLGEKLEQLTRDHPFLWIIDDCQTAESTTIATILGYLIALKLPCLRFLLLSRTVPPFSLSEMLLKDQATVFRQDDLQFSEDETRALFAQNGITTRDAVKAAHDACEGWPAGLWMLLQAYGQGRNITKKRRLTDSTLPEIDKLMEEAVFARHTKEEQHLLAQLSILPFFSPDHARAVTGNMAAPRRLASLCDADAFISYSVQDERFQIHPLYRAFLLSFLRADESVSVPDLYRRSAEWLFEAEYPAEAVRAFAEAGRDDDFARIMDVFAERDANATLLADQETISRIVFGIPWEIKTRRILGYIAFCLAYLNIVDRAYGLRLLTEIDDWLADAEIPGDEKLRLQGEITLARGYARFNDVKGIASWVKKASRLLRGSSRLAGKHLFWSFGCPHVGFLYIRTPGTYAATARYLDVNHPSLTKVVSGSGSGGNSAMRAEMLLETATSPESLSRAESLAHVAIREADKYDQTELFIALSLTLARIALVRGSIAEAENILEAARERDDARAHPLYARSLSVAEAYVQAVTGAYEMKTDWFHTTKLLTDTALRQGMSFASVVIGKQLFRQQDGVRLAAIAKDMEKTFEGKHAFGMLHAKIFAALAEHITYGLESALPLFRDAVETARADALILPFAEYGEAVIPLLDALLDDMPQEKRGRSPILGYIQNIREAALAYRPK
ncbi:MAG: HTH-type transcriptional regulator MalT [Desulfovibrio sp.]